MDTATFDIADLSEMDRLGHLLADHLSAGSVVALIGTLGAGKTRLVQAVAEHLGHAAETVSSPTFVLLREYTDGDLPIYHFDVYRLERAEEFRHLSPDDYFESEGITFVEWADKFPQVLPKNHLEVHIDITGETQRRVQLIAHSAEFEKVIATIRNTNSTPAFP